MASERITNGTFTSNLNGWTTTEISATTPGLGPAATGDIAWAATQSGTCRIQTDPDGNIAYDGAIYQSIGDVTAGTTLRLSGQLWRRLTGTLTADDMLTAIVWCQLVDGSLPKPMLVVKTSNWIAPRRFVPTPITIEQEITAAAAFDSTSFDYDVSHFFAVSGEYRVWCSGDFMTGHPPTNRAQAFFGTVSLLDFGAPGTETPEIPTQGRIVLVESAQSIGTRV